MMFGLEGMDCLGGFLLIPVQPDKAAAEKEASPIVFRKSRRLDFSDMIIPFILVWLNVPKLKLVLLTMFCFFKL
jgi:hypothetical protein